jgi:hypothetical protein
MIIEGSQDVRTAQQFWRFRQNLFCGLCKWRQWRQSFWVAGDLQVTMVTKCNHGNQSNHGDQCSFWIPHSVAMVRAQKRMQFLMSSASEVNVHESLV